VRVREPVSAAGGFLVACGFAAAIPGVELLYDARYHAAGWMVQALAVGAWFRVLATPRIAGLLALGSARSVAIGNGVKFAAIALGVPLAFRFEGLAGALVAFAAADLLRWATLAAASREFASVRRDAGQTLLVGAAGLLGLAIEQALEAPPLVRAAAGAGTAALVCGPPLWLAIRRERMRT
jgi:O-antigen/teichoic acid export membrane protein